MHVAFGADENTSLVPVIENWLSENGHELIERRVDQPWPIVGNAVARAVANGEAQRGVVCCWTGTGVSIAANRVSGVRAALCTNAETVAGARKWNDANVLAIGMQQCSPETAVEMLEAFFSTDVDESERANIDRLS